MTQIFSDQSSLTKEESSVWIHKLYKQLKKGEISKKYKKWCFILILKQNGEKHLGEGDNLRIYAYMLLSAKVAI
jgi:hypothetical protein